MTLDIDTVLLHYIICALWSTNDDDGQPLDSKYQVSDIPAETLRDMREDVGSFVTANHDLLTLSGQSDEQIGHDFWLTRNSHGVGFWDRGLGEVGDKLSDAAKIYGSCDLYVGDDGKLYI